MRDGCAQTWPGTAWRRSRCRQLPRTAACIPLLALALAAQSSEASRFTALQPTPRALGEVFAPGSSRGAQSAPQVFDAVSVKPAANGAHGAPSIDPAHFRSPAATLRSLILEAYGLEDFQLTGGPDWMGSARFSIDAVTAAPASRDEMMGMLRQMLGDRFHLQLARESKEGTVYKLQVAKTGAKFASNGSDPRLPKFPAVTFTSAITPVQVEVQGFDGSLGMGELLVARQADLAALTGALAGIAGAPVSDATQIAGRYDFELFFRADTPEGQAALPTIFDALKEQLGLELQPGRGSYTVYSVTHAEQPSGG